MGIIGNTVFGAMTDTDTTEVSTDTIVEMVANMAVVGSVAPAVAMMPNVDT